MSWSYTFSDSAPQHGSIAAWQHGFGAERPARPARLLAVRVLALLASLALLAVFLFMIAWSHYEWFGRTTALKSLCVFTHISITRNSSHFNHSSSLFKAHHPGSLHMSKPLSFMLGYPIRISEVQKILRKKFGSLHDLAASAPSQIARVIRSNAASAVSLKIARHFTQTICRSPKGHSQSLGMLSIWPIRPYQWRSP